MLRIYHSSQHTVILSCIAFNLVLLVCFFFYYFMGYYVRLDSGLGYCGRPLKACHWLQPSFTDN